MAKIFVGDIGTYIILDMQVDISLATNLNFKVVKPDETEEDWEPEIYNERYLRYQTVEGDLNVSGRYDIQPSLTIGDWTGSGNPVKFIVYPLINLPEES